MKADVRSLTTVLQMMRALDGEVHVRPTEEKGWQLYCMRPDGVTIMNVMMHPGAFPEGIDETPEEFVIEVDRWTKALRTVGDIVDIGFPDGRVRLTGGGMKHTFRLVDVKDVANKFKVPNIMSRLTGECMVEMERLRPMVVSVDEKHIDEIVMTLTDEGFKVSAYDDSLNGVELEMPVGDCALAEGTGESRFPLEAWQEALKAMPADAVLDIHLGVNFPVLVEIGGAVYDCQWVCAPRIPTEEE